MPTCYMMIGIPGSGKSTASKSLIEQMPQLKSISSDEYLEKIAKEKGLTYDQVHREHIDDAEKWMKMQIAQHIAKKQDFIWDQTNFKKTSRKKKINMLHQNRFDVVAIAIELSEQELNYRLNKRVSTGGKKVPWKIVQDMKNSYETPSYEEGFTQILLIGDNNIPELVNKENKSVIKNSAT